MNKKRALLPPTLVYFLREFLEAIRTRSPEAESLMRGFSAYEDEVRRLCEEAEAFGNHTLPALKSELLSGKKPPYEFECTLVRTGINGFVTLFNSHPTEEFLGVVNRFFEEVTHIVSRYGGYVSEFVADEVIFYVKDDEHVSSVATATAAVRDIFAAAEMLDEGTLKSSGYRFTVTSSLAHGRLRFGRLGSGFSLTGPVFIETARILSHVSEREANELYFSDACAERSLDVCTSKFEEQTALKGIAGTYDIWSYTGAFPLKLILSGRRRLEHLRYYRSDEDLVRILGFLKSAHQELENDRFQTVVRLLKDVRLTRAVSTVRKALLEFLLVLEADMSPGDERGAIKVSAACGLIPGLFGPRLKGEHHERLMALLARLAHSADRRVGSSAREAQAFLEPERRSGEGVEELSAQGDNRVHAQALIRAGLGEVSTPVVAQLRKMIESSDPASIASGLYAIGEIARHHRKLDRAGYDTNLAFLRLAGEVGKFLQHPNLSVRRQATIATDKAGRDTSDPHSRSGS